MNAGFSYRAFNDLLCATIVIGVLGGVTRWSFASPEADLRNCRDTIARGNNSLVAEMAILGPLQEKLRETSEQLDKAKKAATDRLKESLEWDRKDQTMKEAQKSFEKLKKPVLEALEKSKPFQEATARKDRDLQKALSEIEGLKKKAIEASAEAARAQAEFTKAQSEWNAIDKKLKSEVSQDRDVITATKAHDEAKSAFNREKRVITGIESELKKYRTKARGLEIQIKKQGQFPASQ